MKKITSLFLLVFYALINSQVKYDTISFDGITLNNHSLYTKFSNIKRFVDDKKTQAKVFTGKDVEIPFQIFQNNDVIYTVFSKNIIFNYEDNIDDKVYITYVKPNSSFKLKIKNEKQSFLLNSKTNISMLKKNFKNSYLSFIKDRKDFRIIVKKNNQYAFIDLVIKNNLISEMFLLKE